MTDPSETASAFASWVAINAERTLTAPQIVELAREIAATGANLAHLQEAWLEVAKHRRPTLDAIRALVRERCASHAGEDGQDRGEAARRAQRAAYAAWWASLSADERDLRTQVSLLDGSSERAGPFRDVVELDGRDERLACGHWLKGIHQRLLADVGDQVRCWVCGPDVRIAEGVQRWAEIQRGAKAKWQKEAQAPEAQDSEHQRALREAYAAIAPRRGRD